MRRRDHLLQWQPRIGTGTQVAAIAYLINSLAPVVDWLRPARYLSPFFYVVGDNQLQHGLPLTWAGVVAGPPGPSL